MNFSKLKNDIPASIVVFLVALPLCLGVALASGAPLLSGIIGGVIGGIVVGFLSSSHTSITGPAAGLVALVLVSIHQLGNFDIFLTAVLIAGFLQCIMGILKTGIFINYIPSNVIKGFLAAIGIILIFKQIPHALGYDIDAEDDFSFFQLDGENTFSELFKMLGFITPGALAISVVSIAILIFWENSFLRKLKYLPSTLFVLIFGVLLSQFFDHFIPYLSIEQVHLVNIPHINTNELMSHIHLPELYHFYDYKVYLVAITIAVVASLETLINIEAADKIDPHKRESLPNRELVAQGIGNMVSGLVGGLPLTSVIARSSVNIQAGSATKLSAILHGLFMLISVFFLSSAINLIPLASLAAILLITGYKLAKVTLFKTMYKKGWGQFIPFVTTIVAILFTNLLVGTLIGLAVSLFFLIRVHHSSPFLFDKTKLHVGEILKLELPNQVSFINKTSIKNKLWNIPENSKIIIDATYCDFIDIDILEIINDFKTIVAPEKNIHLNIIGLKEQYELTDHIQFVNVLDKETQKALHPDEILELLKAGNERFVNGKWSEKYFPHQVNATATGQNPMAVVISCIDSRTSTELIFDLGLGDVFSVRIAGNIINEDILGSIEFGCKVAGAKIIVVLGHTKCGAVKGACDAVQMGNLTTLLEKIKPSVDAEKTTLENRNSGNAEFVEKVAVLNTKNMVKSIMDKSPILKEMIDSGSIGIIGGFHDITTGMVTFFDDAKVISPHK